MRLVCFSDTHGYHNNVKLPAGDVLIFAGDWSSMGEQSEVELFYSFLIRQNFKQIIVIAGNHDKYIAKFIYSDNPKIILLHHSSFIYEGLHFFGSPFTPEFYNWNWMYKPMEAYGMWAKVPVDTDVLITHAPPKKIGDLTADEINVGCLELYKRVNKIKPLAHIYGHIHEGYHQPIKIDGTVFTNVSICNEHYQPLNDPVIIDV